MSIKLKFLLSLVSVSLVTLIFSGFVSNQIQLHSNTVFQQVAGKSLPGSVAVARMATEFYRVGFLLDVYQHDPSDKVRQDIEEALAALGEHQTAHFLFHDDLDGQSRLVTIVDEYNRLVTQYLLASTNNKNSDHLDELRYRLQAMVEEFTFVVTPHIDTDIKQSYLQASSFQEVYDRSFMMLWAYSIAIVVVLVLISLYLSKLVTRPLSQFVHLIERYGQGENVNFDATGNLPKEIRELKNVLQLSIEKREEAEAQLSHQANHDALTDLPNRYLSVDRLNQLIREARRNRSVVAVMFIDLDDFKKFNDSLGHGIGDKILASIADRLRTSVREEDTIGRLGGDEFIGVFGNLNSIIDAQPLAETITSAFQHPFDVDGRQLRLSASIGIAFYPDDGDNSGEILKKADTAMYHSKVSGKNIYTFHSENMYKAVKRRLELEENLLFALENNEFEVVFQPKYASSPIQLEGFEALLRWNSSQLGTVSPEEFIPVAEQSGAIIEIGKCVIKESLDFIKQVNRMFGETYSVAVNLSPAQFREDTLIDQIKTLLHQYDLPAELLEVEITENLLLQENEAIFNTLEKLGAMAVKIAMDDFGKGYSSLNYLRRFHFDVIKIDKDFVRGMATSKSDQELVTATILMAHALDLKVVAEGVETKEQLEFLVDHQCDALQGYYLSKPMARTALAEQLKSDKEKVNLRLVT